MISKVSGSRLLQQIEIEKLIVGLKTGWMATLDMKDREMLWEADLDFTYSKMSLNMRKAALLVCFLLTLCFWPGHACHNAHWGLGRCCPWPALPPRARVAALWKRPPHKHSLPTTECGICSTKEAASNILAELSSMRLLPMKALQGKRFPNNFTFSCWNLAWKKKALHIHTCRGLAQWLLLASVFPAKPWQRSQTICWILLLVELKIKTALIITLPSS